MRKLFFLVAFSAIVWTFGDFSAYAQNEDNKEKTTKVKKTKKDKKKKKKKQLYGVDVDEVTVLGLQVIDGDTIPIYNLDEVNIVSSRFRSKEDERKYQKLKRNIVRVYPYAQRAITLLNEIDAVTSDMNKKRHRKKYVRQLEDELKTQFKGELKKMTVSQGKVLIKLIERGTDKPFYSSLKELKNPVTAFFWNTMGKRFGYNLKEGYNPEDHEDMEALVSYLEDNGAKAQALGNWTFPTTKALQATEDLRSITQKVAPSKKKNKNKSTN